MITNSRDQRQTLSHSNCATAREPLRKTGRRELIATG
jgi:hypothetical protein